MDQMRYECNYLNYCHRQNRFFHLNIPPLQYTARNGCSNGFDFYYGFDYCYDQWYNILSNMRMLVHIFECKYHVLFPRRLKSKLPSHEATDQRNRLDWDSQTKSHTLLAFFSFQFSNGIHFIRCIRICVDTFRFKKVRKLPLTRD